MMSWKNLEVAGAAAGGLLVGGLLVAALGPRYEFVYETKHGKARLKAWTKAGLEELKRECLKGCDQLGDA